MRIVAAFIMAAIFAIPLTIIALAAGGYVNGLADIIKGLLAAMVTTSLLTVVLLCWLRP